MSIKEDNNKNRIVILIAAYNEEEHIKAVIKGCLKYHLDIIVVDDGSTDNTVKKIRSVPPPKDCKIAMIRHRINKGKGKALRTGFFYTIKKNYSGIITLDADGQHDTEEIKDFLEMIEKENPDLIIGNRMADTRSMPFIRLATNIITSWIISVISHRKISDVQSGFRYIRTDVLKNIKLETGNFDTEPEIIMKSSWSGHNIINMPVKTIYHKNFTSYVNPVTDTIKFFRLVFNSFRWKKEIYKKIRKNSFNH
jgi:glycosyltransferase involved in cell wall biosynthesis